MRPGDYAIISPKLLIRNKFIREIQGIGTLCRVTNYGDGVTICRVIFCSGGREVSFINTEIQKIYRLNLVL